MGARFVSTRRTFLREAVLLLTGAAAVARRAWGQTYADVRYAKLSRPVVVPLDDLTSTGRAFPFTAEGMTLPSAAEPNQPVRMNGMVVRTSKSDNSSDQFRAVCLKCPHEGCDVEFIGEPSRVPEEVTTAIGKVRDPVYICPCHNSTFKVDDGSKLFGPAPRGLWRFHVTAVSESAVEIGEVEEDALLVV